MNSRITVPLLLCTLALSLAAVAFIVNGAFATPRAEDVASLCAEAFATNQETPVCPEPSDALPPTLTIAPTVNYPGFSYPLGLNAIAEETETGTTITLAGSRLLFLKCTDCTNTVISTVATAPFALEGTQTLDAYIQETYGADANSVIKKEVAGNGTKYTITNALPAPLEPLTTVRFFGATTEAAVLVPESDVLPVGSTERDAFLASFDFSLIP
jgi:hypothetical protein